jgi:hypothetical protein
MSVGRELPNSPYAILFGIVLVVVICVLLFHIRAYILRYVWRMLTLSCLILCALHVL